MLKSILSSGVTLLIRTIRFKWIGDLPPDNCIIAFWHSQMIAGWWISRKDAVALVSKSKDGDYLNSILMKWSYTIVRGSSSVSGKEALQEAIELIANGKAKRLVITPDGPRGPREIFKRGAFIAARELSLPLYFISIEYKHAIHLPKSWDKFQIPLPFSKIIISSHLVKTDDLPSDLDLQKEYLSFASLHYRTFPLPESNSTEG